MPRASYSGCVRPSCFFFFAFFHENAHRDTAQITVAELKYEPKRGEDFQEVNVIGPDGKTCLQFALVCVCVCLFVCVCVCVRVFVLTYTCIYVCEHI
jgi:hypothetical protein